MGWRGGTHRSWPGGRGGRPRPLIPGEGQEGLAWRGKAGGGQGGGARVRGGCKGFGSGGVGGRDTGPRDGANFATCIVFLSFLTRTKRRKMCGVGRVPTGAGLVPPELAWWTGGSGRRGYSAELAWWTGGREAGQGLRGGCKGFGSGGVGGRDTGPRDGANFATCVVFLSFLTRTKRRKIAFFEGCRGGYPPTGAGLVDGGVDQAPWLQERVGGGIGAMAVPGRSKFRNVCRIFVVSNAYKKKKNCVF